MNLNKSHLKTRNILTVKSFFSFFTTQFLGAIHDNLIKNALSIFIVYQSYSIGGFTPDQMVALAGGLFIAPFFLFSALAGQLADKYPKNKLILYLKFWEMLIAFIAAYGFINQNVGLLLFSLFQLGLQSAFFGPVKYSILPQILTKEELTSGTAYTELGTFLAILIGTILGGVLIGLIPEGLYLLAVFSFVFSIFGLVASFFISDLKAEAPLLKIKWNPITTTWSQLKIARKNKAVFHSILGISWFWFIGAIILSVLPTLTKDVLNGSTHIVTFFLALFSIGIGVGSLICEKLSYRKLELGLVPFGSIGISVISVLLGLILYRSTGINLGEVQGLYDFLKTFNGLALSLFLLFFSVVSGFFIVPLYTLLQERSESAERSRVIAANNIINALFMVFSAIGLALFFEWGFPLYSLFYILAILNAIVALYIYTLIPEFLFRFLCWIIANIIYRLDVFSRRNIPVEGPAVLVSNHVGFLDWLIIASASPRPIRFVMHHSFLKIPGCGKIFKDAKVIPIAGAKENPELMENAFLKIKEALDLGELVCIFPEGMLTRNGEINPFRPGIERIIKNSPVPVIPMALSGIWGSYFSYESKPFAKPFKRMWSKVVLNVGEALPPEQVSAALLELKVKALRLKA